MKVGNFSGLNSFFHQQKESTQCHLSLCLGLSSLVYRGGLEMMCNVALERRMGFLNGVDEPQEMSQDMVKILTALKGYQAASNQAMYGLPWWKYVPASLSGVFTRLVEHKDTLFYTIGSLVDGTMSESVNGIEETSILGKSAGTRPKAERSQIFSELKHFVPICPV